MILLYFPEAVQTPAGPETRAPCRGGINLRGEGCGWPLMGRHGYNSHIQSNQFCHCTFHAIPRAPSILHDLAILRALAILHNVAILHAFAIPRALAILHTLANLHDFSILHNEVILYDHSYLLVYCFLVLIN